MTTRSEAHRLRGAIHPRALVAAAIVVLALLVLVRGAFKGAGESDELVIGVDVWVGFAPLQVALDEGYFTDEGLSVRLVTLTGAPEMRAALSSKRVLAVTTSLDTALRKRSAGVPARVALGLDRSTGADGLVARSPVGAIADLRGQRVAFGPATPSEFFLLFLLDQAGVPVDSIKPVEMSSADAGAAFVAGKIDVAVTWEPWLSQAVAVEGATLLASTAEWPNVILDVLLVHDDLFEKRPDDVRALRRAWFRAVALQRSEPERFAALAAPHYGVDIETFKAMVSGLEYLDAPANGSLFGEVQSSGPVYDVVEAANRVFSAERAVPAIELVHPLAAEQ